jgi:hypothetical protein
MPTPGPRAAAWDAFERFEFSGPERDAQQGALTSRRCRVGFEVRRRRLLRRKFGGSGKQALQLSLQFAVEARLSADDDRAPDDQRQDDHSHAHAGGR